MPTPTVEDYLKRILLLAKRTEKGRHSGWVALGALAESLSVVPGTVTAMVKRLHAARLVEYERYGGVRLTAAGTSAAVQVLRRHRIIETFLVECLRLDWAKVHDEAERLEHAVSETVLARLEAFLNYPTVDPHGDPIPQADGTIAGTSEARLSDSVAGDRLRVVRVVDQTPEFLDAIDGRKLRPGATVEVTRLDRAVGMMDVRIGKTGQAISLSLAERLVVEPVKPAPRERGRASARPKR